MAFGKRSGYGTIFPVSSRFTCQQSSITMYWYPASFIPDETIASAAPFTRSSLTLQPNLFQVFHPIGGVSAKPLDGGVCAKVMAETNAETMANNDSTLFMNIFSVFADSCTR